MKRIILIFTVVISTLFAGCGLNSSSNGELIGVQGRQTFSQEIPYGMVYVPSGTFHMGQNDQDVAYAQVARNRQVTISAFYMDDTEITNNEYRQFIFYVRDSIAHTLIGDDHIMVADDGSESIDWKKKIKYGDPEVQELLAELYLPEDERVFGKKELDTKKLKYSYEWFDYKQAARRSNKDQPRTSFIKKDEVDIYPDTLTWIRDFAYSMNEPMVEKYFWHPAYDDYPLVGIDWRQARVFTGWRSEMFDSYRKSKGQAPANRFRLPSEAEWEYASRGGRIGADYPWGGPYIRNSKGCLLANFKPMRGDYISDGGFYTVKVTSYFPNDYGLYNMAGNVAEWTASAYDESGYSFVHDMNPNFEIEVKDEDPENMKRKVIRGGSWKDIGYFLQNGTRTYEYMDTAKAFVGFRCVMSYMGRSIEDE
jgi:sulfatase modifying factor 1